MKKSTKKIKKKWTKKSLLLRSFLFSFLFPFSSPIFICSFLFVICFFLSFSSLPFFSPQIIISGLPRTGSTFLHQLLSKDPNCRFLSVWFLFLSLSFPFSISFFPLSFPSIISLFPNILYREMSNPLPFPTKGKQTKTKTNLH